MAETTKALWCASIYALSLSLVLGTSALYHRITWSPEWYRWIRRIDHTMIFVLIAGTYTPFALMVFEGTLSQVVFVILWAAVLVGLVFNLLWENAPKWLRASLYVSVSWSAVAALPEMTERLGLGCVALMLGGGLIYSLGALVYAIKRPNPKPMVFGYHEIFHACVVMAAAVHYTAVAVFVIAPLTTTRSNGWTSMDGIARSAFDEVRIELKGSRPVKVSDFHLDQSVK